MYFTENQSTRNEPTASAPLILHPLQQYRYDGSLGPSYASVSGLAAPSHPILNFGEAAVTPKGLALLEHFHVPKEVDPKVVGRFVARPITKLHRKHLNPGFVDANDQLITDTGNTGLQTCLAKLITTQFQNYLAKPGNATPSASDRLRVALVDLTGHKLTKPDFAGWGSTVPMYGASVPKILALYGAFQLRSDLQNLAATQKLLDGKALEQAVLQNWKATGLRNGFPDLVWLFNIRKWTGTTPLEFTKSAVHSFENIMKNCPAGELIARVGFPYIGSLTWQSGLRHPIRGGLWLPKAYCEKGSWSSNPIPISGSNSATALSVATYFTLLAQGRMVDDAASVSIRRFLRNGCTTGLFPAIQGVVSSKCGIWSDYLHDCILVGRSDARYAVAVLTRTKRTDWSRYTQLFMELDNLIVRNNRTPKPVC